MDSIELTGISFHAYHGVMPQERIVGNNYTVDLRLSLSLSEASLSDDLKDTVNYAEVYRITREEMAIPSSLLEHAAGRIARRIKSHFPQIGSVRIRLAKKNPPLGADLQEAAVILTIC